MLPATRYATRMKLAAWHAGGTLVDVGGERVFARDDGAGPAVLLLHGLPTSSYDWDPLVAALKGRYRCVSLDFLGFGASSKPDRPYSYEAQLDAVAAVVRAKGLTDVFVVAHDYGATVAQELLARMIDGSPVVTVRGALFLNAGLNPALHRPRPIQRLLAGPLGPWVGPLLTSRRTFERSLRGVLTRPERMDFEAHWDALAMNGGARIFHRLMHYMAERRQNAERWTSAFAKAPVPVAFAWGTEDPVSGAHVLEWIRAIQPAAPTLALAVGHYPQAEAEAEVNAFVAACLDGWAA